MPLGRAFSVAVRGLDGEIVEIEADITSGLAGGASGRAARRRAAGVARPGAGGDHQLRQHWPMARLTLALSPATLPKMGSVYDLALALAVLSADRKKSWAAAGEDRAAGRIGPRRPGAAGEGCAARGAGGQAARAGRGGRAHRQPRRGQPGRRHRGVGCAHARPAAGWLAGKVASTSRVSARSAEPEPAVDLADVVGQSHARFAVEVAAAGAHHLMLTGPPGIGKTMLAQRLPGCYRRCPTSEALEVTAIHSVAGLLSGSAPLITRPPFVAPHHTSSVAALVGGGSGMARPGAVSRAHRGVLLLDECAEIGVSVLEALRTPLEDGEIRLARRDGVACYPARFQLVLAANPCPCAPADPQDCICAAGQAPLSRQVVRAAARSGGPARRDAFGPVRRVRRRGRRVHSHCRDRVAVARRRPQSGGRRMGSAPTPRSAARFCAAVSVDDVGDAPLRTALDRGVLSIRGVDRSLRVAWTLADLAGRDVAGPDDVTTALSFRQAGGLMTD